MDSGAQSVTITGTSMMLTLYAGSWGTVLPHRPGPMLALEVARDRFGWTTFAVLGTRRTWTSVNSKAGGCIIVVTMRTPV